MSFLPTQRTMVALDNMDQAAVHTFLKTLPQDIPLVKIGLEQYLAGGRALVQEIHELYGKEIFLDLKLHDIPNTVAKAMTSLIGLPIKFLTVHLSGGKAMLEAAQEVREKHFKDLNILGVSYLTSLDQGDLKDLFNYEEDQVAEAFSRFFDLAQNTGTQGIVCSAFEAKHVAPRPLIKVCPGIRFQDEIGTANMGDQKRVMDPASAFKAGADYLVMGRSLTQAQNLEERIKELNGLNIA